MCIFGCAGKAHSAGRYLNVDYPASTVPGELRVAVTYVLWIPDGVAQIRGIIVHQHGAGTTASKEGSTAAYDLHWQALAKKWDCALLGPSYHVQNEKIDISPGASELWFDPRRGSEKTFLKALADLALSSGHPEIEAVPWALWGHSGGGIWSDVMASLHPDRVAVVFMRSGSALMFLSHPEFTPPKVPDALYGIPMMCNPGVKEKPAVNVKPEDDKRTPEEKMKGPWPGNIATVREYRAKGAFIALAPDPRTGHECGDSRYLAIPFIDACLAIRLPDKGSKDQKLKPVDASKAWLAPLLGAGAVPAAEYKENAAEANWFVNEAVAKAWMEYVKSGAVNDTTPPPAPNDVRISVMEGKSVEITWDAEADFESGIRQFIIMRDGQELAKVPENPKGKFGRPLFQSMTYHDTPDQPMPAMRYLDGAAKADEKHSYSVVTVNSVGLESKASAQGQAAEPSAIPVKSDAPTSLYGGGAASSEDGNRKQAGDSFNWKRSAQLTWNVQVDRAGDYEVALNHAAEPGAVGQRMQVSSGNSPIEYTMAKTKGVFGDKSYEMTSIQDRLHLEAGTQSIALSIPDAPKDMGVLSFRSLELDSRRRQSGHRGRPAGGAAGAGLGGFAAEWRWWSWTSIARRPPSSRPTTHLRRSMIQERRKPAARRRGRGLEPGPLQRL